MEIFKLFGSVFVDTKKAEESTHKIGQQAEGLGSKFAKGAGTVAKWGAAVGGAAVAGGAALFGMANHAAGVTDRIDKLSNRLGLSRQAFQELDFVMSQSGVDIQSFQTGMKSLLKNMDGVTEKNKTSIANFQKLGVSVTDASGKMRSQQDVLYETISAFQKMENSSEKSRLAQELFGKQGQEIMPLLSGQAGSFEELTQKARDLGLVLGDDTIDAGVKLTDTLDQTKRAFGSITAQIGAKVMPMVQNVLEIILNNMPLIQQVMGVVFDFIGNAVSGVVDIFNIFFLPAIRAVIAFVTEHWGEIQAVIGSVMSAVQDIIQAVWGIIQIVWEKYGDNILSVVKSVFNVICSVIKGAMGIIKGVIKIVTGIIKGDWKQVWEGIKQIAQNVWDILKSVIQNSVNIIQNIIKTALDFIKTVWKAGWNIVKSTVSGIFGGIKNIISNGINGAKDIVTRVLNSIKSAFKNVLNGAADIVRGAIDRIKSFFNFSWSLPHIKLPHFSIRGKFSLTPPSIPHIGVSWYKKAMEEPYLFTKPTIFQGAAGIKGAGEAGDEIMYGRSNLLKDIRNATQDNTNKDIVNKLDKLIDLLDKRLPEIIKAQAKQIVLDTGTLVGEITPQLDSSMGIYQGRRLI